VGAWRPGYDDSTKTVDFRPCPPRASLPPLNPSQFRPTPERPLRGKTRALESHEDIQPHHHDWGQLVFSISGAVRVNTESSTFIVPPSRAVWVPPNVVHAVTAIEHAQLRTVYLLPGLLEGEAWRSGRVLEVSPLLRELLLELSALPDPQPQPNDAERQRQADIGRLILTELQRARPLGLGVALPRDARLRRLCEAMLREPTRLASFEACAAEVGASPRTLSRLFRDELGTSFAQWRSQLLLAHAVTLAARRRPMSHIAAELGYASASAFSAWVSRTVGMPPSRFFAEV
jgi:AraC-like DNA-binding protein/mannose-6-phosphate isomerase-like protein (cupin superfamily)